MRSKNISEAKKKIVVVDFGSQVTKLIARRIRELKIYCEVLNLQDFEKINDFSQIKGIILSGGPSTVTKKSYPKIRSDIFKKGIPILGICYGLQLITKFFGGKIKKTKKKKRIWRGYTYRKNKFCFI